MLYVLSQMLYPVENPPYIATVAAGSVFFAITTALDMLLLNPMEAGDFIQHEQEKNGKGSGSLSAFQSALGLMVNPRRIGSRRQAKNTPSLAKYYNKAPEAGNLRIWFLIRETCIAAWQYLFLDILSTRATSQASQPFAERDREGYIEAIQAIENGSTQVQAQLWLDQLTGVIFTWFIAARIFMSLYHRAVAILSVAINLSSPGEFPPLFGRVGEAYTLRNYWGCVFILHSSLAG